jgi:tRNA-dihydrouridine synthase B
VRIARIAEDAGIAALALHGRTRACAFEGAAEYASIAAVKRAVSIPVFANGDIVSPAQARTVLRATGADGLMIGRAAQGRPWIFREIGAFLATGRVPPSPTVAEVRGWVVEHLHDHHAFHGAVQGVRTARKHLAWYSAGLAGADAFRTAMNACETPDGQLAIVRGWFDRLEGAYERIDDARVRALPAERAPDEALAA